MPKLISQKNFTNIEINYAKTTSTPQQIIDSFSKNRFRSVKYQIQVTNDASYHTANLLAGKLVLESGDKLVLSGSNASDLKFIGSILETLN